MAVGIGVEVGSAGLRAAVLERQGSSLNLLAWQELPCDTGSPEVLAQGLSTLRRTLRVKQGVVLGLPTASVLLTTVEPLIVDARRASLAVQFELQQYLPFDLSQASWHYQWINGLPSSKGKARRLTGPGSPEGISGTGRTAVVVAIKRSRLEERMAACRRAGMAIRVVSVNPLAALNVLRQPRDSASALWLHLDGSQAEWIIWSQNRLQIVPIAVDLAALSLDDVVQELGHSLEALRGSTGIAAGPAAPVRFFGVHPALREMEERLKTALHVSVARDDLERVLRMSKVRVEPVERACVAVGLALQGMGVMRLGVNLLEEAQAEGRIQRIRHLAVAASGVCGVVALGCGISAMTEVWQRRTRTLALLEARERHYQALRPEVRQLLKQQEHVQDETAQLRGLAADRTLLSQAVVDVTRAMPADVWWTKLNLSKDERLQGLVEGQAKSFQSVTQLIDQLKSAAGMTTVKPQATNVVTDAASGQEVVAFSVLFERTVLEEPPAGEDDTALDALDE